MPKKRTIVIAAVIAGVLLALLALLPAAREGEEGRTVDYYSAFSPSPGGLKALAQLLKELGYDTRRIIDRPGSEDWENRNVVFMLESPRPLTYDDLAVIERWVDHGGTLVVSSGNLVLASSLIDSGVLGERKGSLFEEPALPKTCRPDGTSWTACPEPSEAVSIASGVWTLQLGQFGSTYDEPLAARSCLARSEGDEGGGYDILLAGDCRPLVAVRRWTQGRVVFLHDPSFALNRNIARRGNVKLVLGLLDFFQARHGGDLRIGFDEYPRLIDEKRSSVWDALGPGARLAFYQFLFLFFLAAVGFSRRFAPARKPSDTKIRTSLMQTETLSAIMERTRSYGLALKLIHRHARTRWNGNAMKKTPARRKLYEELERLETRVNDMSGRSGESREMLRRYLSALDKLNEEPRP
jgi:hypothetical protein